MDVSTPKGIADHAETISDYLYEYGVNPLSRKVLSLSFYVYLLSACWQKLYKRFSSWRALGLIRNFETRVASFQEHLTIIGEAGMSLGSGDRTLQIFLYQNRKFIFHSMLPTVPPPTIENPVQWGSVFDKLHQAVINYNSSPGENSPNMYTTETAMGFHYLFWGAFILAGRAIRDIKDNHAILKNSSKQQDNKQESVFRTCILAAVLPMKLLHCVLSSTMFKNHIIIWTDDGASIGSLLPKWSQKKANLQYGLDRQIRAKGLSEESDDGDGNGNNDSNNDDDSDGDDDGWLQANLKVCTSIC
jgi:hypothetical protein